MPGCDRCHFLVCHHLPPSSPGPSAMITANDSNLLSLKNKKNIKSPKILADSDVPLGERAYYHDDDEKRRLGA